MPGQKTILKKGKAQEAAKKATFRLDLAQPISDGVIEGAEFVDYLKKNIKVKGRKENLGEAVSVRLADTKVQVQAVLPFSKRYVKYLSKKYLKKQDLRDYLHIVATDKDTYTVKFFEVGNDEAAE